MHYDIVPATTKVEPNTVQYKDWLDALIATAHNGTQLIVQTRGRVYRAPLDLPWTVSGLRMILSRRGSQLCVRTHEDQMGATLYVKPLTPRYDKYEPIPAALAHVDWQAYDPPQQQTGRVIAGLIAALRRHNGEVCVKLEPTQRHLLIRTLRREVRRVFPGSRLVVQIHRRYVEDPDLLAGGGNRVVGVTLSVVPA